MIVLRMAPTSLALALLCFGMLSSAKAQQSEHCDAEQSFGRSDKTLFGSYCGTCHTISGKWRRINPTPLGGLFEREKLVNGQPVTEENVRALIAKGGPNLMPGFEHTLSSEQITELVQFLKVARCPGQGSASK